MVFYDLGTQGSADAGSTTYQTFQPECDSVADGPLEVVWVQADSLPSTSPPTTPAPTITNQPDPMTLRTSNSVGVAKLDYTDPYPCKPIFCHLFPNSSPSIPCTRGKRDGYRVGRTYFGVRFKSVPETTTEVLQDDIVPISGDGCPDISDHAVSGDGSFKDPLVFGPDAASTFAVGAAVSVTITIMSADGASGGGSCTFTETDCCAGSPGIQAIECAVDNTYYQDCGCPGNTQFGGAADPNNTWCICP
jgi:hypothetical protein